MMCIFNEIFVTTRHLRLKTRTAVFLTLSHPIFLPTAYSPALVCFGRERGWWITCNYPTVLKEKNTEKQKEYNLRYLLAKVRTTWGKASGRLRQRANKRNKNRVGRLPTLERNRKIILSDEVRRRIGEGYWWQLCRFSAFTRSYSETSGGFSLK
jgi:hypothetical protein